MDQGSNKNHSPAYNFTPTVTKFCVMWEGLSLPHDTKLGDCRCKIVDSRLFHSWSLIHGLRWSGLIKVGPGVQQRRFVWALLWLLSVYMPSVELFGALYKKKHPFICICYFVPYLSRSFMSFCHFISVIYIYSDNPFNCISIYTCEILYIVTHTYIYVYFLV